MNKQSMLTLVAILMVISAVLMFILAINYGNWAPAITGIGFLITAWGFKALGR